VKLFPRPSFLIGPRALSAPIVAICASKYTALDHLDATRTLSLRTVVVFVAPLQDAGVQQRAADCPVSVHRLVGGGHRRVPFLGQAVSGGGRRSARAAAVRAVGAEAQCGRAVAALRAVVTVACVGTAHGHHSAVYPLRVAGRLVMRLPHVDVQALAFLELGAVRNAAAVLAAGAAVRGRGAVAVAVGSACAGLADAQTPGF
jgi:hypothetical protein